MSNGLAFAGLVGGVVVGIIAMILIRRTVYIIREHELGMLERVGKYVGRPMKPGLHFKRPIFDRLVARLDLRLRNIDIIVDARTQGNGARVLAYVFVEYQVNPSSAYEAHYNLADPTGRLKARATEIVQIKLYTMSLEQAMESGTQIGDAIRDKLTAYAAEHGYLITNVVVTHVEPESSVLSAMSEQAALARRSEIARDEADAENARGIAAARTAAEVSKLEGEASAAQQTAIFEAIQTAARKLATEQNMCFADALRSVIRTFEITATRDSVVGANSSIVTVGGSAHANELTRAVAAGTQVGDGHASDA